MKGRFKKCIFSIMLCCVMLVGLLPSVPVAAVGSDTRAYEYVGSSLDKVYDGQPVKVLTEKILVTDNGMVEQPLYETGLLGKYVEGLWYKVEGDVVTAIEGTQETKDDGWDAYALVGPTDPGDYQFVLQSAFPDDWEADPLVYTKFETISFTISEAAHTHTYGEWEKADDNQHKRTCECGEVETAEHKWNDGEITTKATHTTEGVKTYTCTVCKATKTEPVAKLTEHTYGEWEKADENKHKHTCECGEVETAEHKYGGDSVVCTVCGYKKMGEVTSEDNSKNNALNADIQISGDTNLGTLVLTKEDEQRVENGESVNIRLEVADISEAVSTEDKEKVNSVLGDNKVGMYLDINLYKQIGSDEKQKVTQTNGGIRITITVPDELISKNATAYVYKIVRVHEGVATILDGTFDEAANTFTFETDQFSTYTLIYSEAAAERPTTPTVPTAPQTGDSSNMFLWIVLLLISGFGILGAAIYFKKKIEYIK